MTKPCRLWGGVALMTLLGQIHRTIHVHAAGPRGNDDFSSIDEYNRNLLWLKRHDDSSSSRGETDPSKSAQSKLRRPDHYFVPLAKNNNPLWGLEHLDTGERRGPVSEASLRPIRPSKSPSQTAPTSNRRHSNHPNHNHIKMLAGGSSDANPEEPSREKIFQFRQRYGKVKIDLGEPKPSSEPAVSKARRLFWSSSSDINDNINATTVANATETANGTLAAIPIDALHASSKSNTKPKTRSYNNNHNKDVEISLSVDPASVIRLGQVAVKASVGVVGAFAATLRLLAPMIVARRALTTVGYICYDYYNGRYLRTTYNRHWERYHTYDGPAVLRAAGRFAVQVLAMGIAVPLTIFILNHSPCWMPEVLCHYWYASICLGIALFVGKVAEGLMTKHCAKLDICTVETRENTTSRRYFTRPWHILQWMRDPDAWISNIARLNNNQRRKYVPFQPDALLFPSTWPPLHLLILLAMARAIRISLLNQEPSTVYLLLRKFCMTHVLYEEWYRVFLKEKRVALAAVVHGVFFVSLANLIYNAALVDGIAGLLLVPAKVASLVTGWMNLVLYNERVVTQRGNKQQRGLHGKRQKSKTNAFSSLMGSLEDF